MRLVMATNETNDKKKHPDDAARDGRERLKNIDTLEEYYKLTNTKGHSADDKLDFQDMEQPQDKDKKPLKDDDDE